MAKPISQREAAQRHIDCAIRLVKTDDLEAHTLAYAAYGLLRELLGGATQDAVRKLEKKLKLGEIPNYFKHRYSNPEPSSNSTLLRRVIWLSRWPSDYGRSMAKRRLRLCVSSPLFPVRMSRANGMTPRLRWCSADRSPTECSEGGNSRLNGREGD